MPNSKAGEFLMCSKLQLVIPGIILFCSIAWGGYTPEFQMSTDDVFRVVGKDQWRIDVEKELTLRFAEVRITSISGYPFNMMLYFKCDTPDLQKFDTAEKIAHAVRSSSEAYLPHILEKQIKLKSISIKSKFGFLTVLTDAEVAQKATPMPDEFKYLTRGMVRLSKDSVLGFSIMSNDTESSEYKQLLDYVYAFVKAP
jgi:hypothetical protein